MTRFRYTGNNGLVGEADSPYFAIVQAIGRPAAEEVDVVWGHEEQYSQRGDEAEVLGWDDEVIGKVVNLG